MSTLCCSERGGEVPILLSMMPEMIHSQMGRVGWLEGRAPTEKNGKVIALRESLHLRECWMRCHLLKSRHEERKAIVSLMHQRLSSWREHVRQKTESPILTLTSYWNEQEDEHTARHSC